MRLSSGDRLAHYEILSLLGQGGMGVVYRALDTKLNRPVAVKILSSEVADSTARRRFQREAQTASSLNHPHIVTVYDVGEVDGEQYIVTEFVDGGTLKEWAAKQKPSWKQVVDLLTGVADGLAAAHQAGILHRDIKPANILVARNGYAKLADFGLAKLDEPPSDETQTLTEARTEPGRVIGTIAYMSPEQASGTAVDARSDIFSLGILLYEMISGSRPFHGRSELELLKTIIDGQHEPLGNDVPAELGRIVDKALEKDPADRYQSAREMVVDLRRLNRQVTEVSAKRAAVPGKPVGLIAAVAALSVALVVAGVWLARVRSAPQVSSPLANASFNRLTAFPGAEHDASISPDGKWVLFLADRDGPVDAFLGQIGTGRFENLTHGKTSLATRTPHGLGFFGDGSEIWFRDTATKASPMLRIPLMGGTPRVFLAPPQSMKGSYVAIDWSKDSRQTVLHTSEDGDPTFVGDHLAENLRLLLNAQTGGLHQHYPVWSIDGRWIYFVRGLPAVGDMDIWRVSPEGGEAEQLTHLNANINYLATLDDRNVLFTAPDASGAGPWLWTLDVESRNVQRVSRGVEQYQSISASADRRRLVATRADPVAGLWSVPILDRVATESDVKAVKLPTIRALAPRYSASALFYLSSIGTGDGLWRFQNESAIEIWRGADGALTEAPAVSADGLQVVFPLRRKGHTRLMICSTEGGVAKVVTDAIEVSGAASWSPNGETVVTAGNDGDPKNSGLYAIPLDGSKPRKLVSGTVSNPVWSADGSVIAYMGPQVGPNADILAIRPNGEKVEVPAIPVSALGPRLRFVPGTNRLIYMQPEQTTLTFGSLDIATGQRKTLANLAGTATTRTFDVSRNGKEIIFDRLRDNSDIVVIDLLGPGK